MKTVLHVGCGPENPEKLPAVFRSLEWREVRLDIDPDVAPEIIGSITDLSMIDSGSVDAIWSSHNVEHLYAHEVPIALREFRRVLKADGFALILVPDIEKAARLIAEGKLEEPAYMSPAGPITPLDTVYGLGRAIAEGNHFMAHRTGFSPNRLGRLLVEAGFVQVLIQRDDFDLTALGLCRAQSAPEGGGRLTMREALRKAAGLG